MPRTRDSDLAGKVCATQAYGETAPNDGICVAPPRHLGQDQNLIVLVRGVQVVESAQF